MTDTPEEMLDSISKLMEQVESYREILTSVMRQSENDLQSAHAEICKLQGIDPQEHTWPRWSPQANSLRWFAILREKFSLD